MPAELSHLAAFVIGLLSTFHCWGMCGGIVGALSLAIPAPVRRSRRRELMITVCYNLGRIGSYGIAGLLAASAGFLLGAATGTAGHLVLRVLSGLILVFLGLHIGGWFRGLVLVEKAGGRIWRLLQPLGRPFLPMDRPYKAVVIGAIWGWFPCGLVYSVLLWAAASADPVRGASYMLAFGLGTLPGMVAAGWFAGRLPASLHLPLIRQTAGVLLVLLGLAVLFAPHLSAGTQP